MKKKGNFKNMKKITSVILCLISIAVNSQSLPGSIPYVINSYTDGYIPIGTAGQSLISNGSIPTWSTVPSSGGGGSGTMTGTLAANQIATGVGTNTLTGSNNFTYNQTTKHLTVGGISQWEGIAGLSPKFNFRKDTIGPTYMVVENQNDTGRVGIFIVGTPTNTPADNSRYFGMTLGGGKYSILAPEYRNVGILQSGGDDNGIRIYADAGDIDIGTTETYTAPYNYFGPDLHIESYFDNGIQNVINPGWVGINTNNPQARLDVIGNFRSTANIVSGYSNIPFTDNNGVSNANPKVLANYQDGSILMNLSVRENSGNFGWLQSYNSNTSASSAVINGSYSSDFYMYMRSFNASYSGSYPFLPSTHLIMGRSAPINIGTYDNFPLTFFTNATQVGGFGTAGTFSAIGSITGASIIKSGGSSTQALMADGSVSTPVRVINATDLTALTTATTIATFTPSAAGTFKIGGYLTVTAVTTDVINFQATWTDETSTVRTATFPSVSTTGYVNQAETTIRVKASTAITISTVLTTGVGSITYDCGSTLIQVK